MATSSLIAVQKSDNSYACIRVHWGQDLGPILTTHYASPTRADQLLALGDLSYLEGPDLKNDCSAYHRDLNEGWIRNAPRNCPSPEAVVQLAKASGCDHILTFEEGKWTPSKVYA